MRMAIRLLAIVVALVVSVTSTSWAQKGAVELGADMVFEYSLTDNINGFDVDNVFQISVPVLAIRAGFFTSDALSIEPSLGFQLVNVDETLWAVQSVILVLYHFNSDPTQSRWFMAVGPSLLAAGGGGETATQFGVIGEGGVKLPVAEKFALRLGAGVGRFFENDDFVGSWDIFGRFGFSVFLGG